MSHVLQPEYIKRKATGGATGKALAFREKQAVQQKQKRKDDWNHFRRWLRGKAELKKDELEEVLGVCRQQGIINLRMLTTLYLAGGGGRLKEAGFDNILVRAIVGGFHMDEREREEDVSDDELEKSENPLGSSSVGDSTPRRLQVSSLCNALFPCYSVLCMQSALVVQCMYNAERP